MNNDVIQYISQDERHQAIRKQKIFYDIIKNMHNYSTMCNPYKSDLERTHASIEFINFVNKCIYGAY